MKKRIIATIGILIFDVVPTSEHSVLLVINASSSKIFDSIIDVLKKETLGYKIKSKNISKNGMDMIVEIKLKRKDSTMEQLYLLDSVEAVTMLENNVDVKS